MAAEIYTNYYKKLEKKVYLVNLILIATKTRKESFIWSIITSACPLSSGVQT